MEHNLWNPELDSLKNLNEHEICDLMCNCFIKAQKETFERAKKNLGREFNEEEIKKGIIISVKLSFKRINADFDNPTLNNLKEVIKILAKKARAMGTPKDIIEHHVELLNFAIEHAKPVKN